MSENHNQKSWQDLDLYASDPTILVDQNGKPITLDPVKQYWFIKRSYDEEAARSLTDEQREAVFHNIPLIVRSAGFVAIKNYDLEGWLRTTYLWARGQSLREVGRLRDMNPSDLSRGMKIFGNTISKQRTLEQLIKGDIPESPVETPEQKKLNRARKFLSGAYPDEIVEALPDSMVDALVKTAVRSDLMIEIPTEHHEMQLERLDRWMNGESFVQIAIDQGTSHQTVSASVQRLGRRLAKSFPTQDTTTNVWRSKKP